MYEIPIASVRNNIFRYISALGSIRIANKKPLGVGFVRPKQKSNFLNTLLRRLCGFSWVSLDTRSAKVILLDLNSLYKKYNCDNRDSVVSLIGHTKMFSERHFENLDTLLSGIKKTKRMNYTEKDGLNSSLTVVEQEAGEH